jgi:ABC-type transporter Mla maintaining outer membrane lipid asymmetry ATPase subunit MlaF
MRLAGDAPSGGRDRVSGATIAIAVEGLVKNYQGLRPLRVGHLDVRTGERVAISGLDATAAEVFVNLVNGAILPDSGEVRVFGRATSAIVDEAEWFASLDRFGIVTPRAVLLEASTVRQNIALPFTIDIDHLEAPVCAQVAALAREVGLDESVCGQVIAHVPTAQRMRIHLARALATGPQVLLMEHPTVSVPRDQIGPLAVTVTQVAEARRLTLLAITEDTEFADAVATAHFKLQGGTGALVNARGWRRWLPS